MTKNNLLFIFLFLFSTSIYSQTKYVSITGNDNNDGSIEHPYKTVSKALSKITSGEILIRKGRYMEEILMITKK
jgi:hypothetical protein